MDAWIQDEFLDVLGAHLAPMIQHMDPHGAASARQTCSSWNAAFRSSNHACIKVNFWTHTDISTFSTWLRNHRGSIRSLQLSTEDQDWTGQDLAISVRALADALPVR